MKGYYLWAPVEAGCIGNGSGVEKKINSQVKVLKHYFNVELVVLPPSEPKHIDKILHRIPFMPVNRLWKYKGEFDDADFVYIRQVQHDFSFVQYLKCIKCANPRIKIIYEVPTYPYEMEKRITIKNFPFYAKDRINRRKLQKYVDRIVTFYDQKMIFGIPTLRLINGFDFESIQLSQKIIEPDTINIIEVSTTAFWHGYDRFISGLHNYYTNGGKRDIKFHMVGLILPDLQKLVEDYSLNDHVIFHGILYGKELDDVYRTCIAGVDILGGHRKDYPVSGSLKSREYVAQGLPVITSSRIDFMDDSYPYQLVLPYDDTPIEIEKVIQFIDSCYMNKGYMEVSNKIRAYGEGKCDMTSTMGPIISYIRGD